ncbi:hypothetical protein ITP53_33690 [Nonomuraea sp. K274]|uniref:DNA ligase (ATP) n=1 Tax=Nonomuraea cypriaca TaxID=1187855 RepID=A0A931F2D9_9ACTN|nr:hypothetical protein [Nonomuraea cypriaca]MBF8190582.1 hypothetical protein [Nonomuraea cypriaca]
MFCTWTTPAPSTCRTWNAKTWNAEPCSQGSWRPGNGGTYRPQRRRRGRSVPQGPRTAPGRGAARLAPHVRPDSRFDEEAPRPYARDARWVDPALVGDVQYTEWTADGRPRHPSWRGLPPDKWPDQVQREDGGDQSALIRKRRSHRALRRTGRAAAATIAPTPTPRPV